MKLHYVEVSALCLREDLEPLREAMSNILPEGAEIREEVLSAEAEGEVFTHELHKLSATIKGREAGELVKKILSSLDEYDLAALKEKAPLCVDDKCAIYFRLSKREAALGRMVLDSRDSIHVMIKPAVYAGGKEKAVELLNGLLDEAVK